MKRLNIMALLLVLFCLSWIVITVVPARASTIDLVEWAFMFNETAYTASGDATWDPWDPSASVPVSPYVPSNPIPGTFDFSLFDWYSGLGTITISGFSEGANSFRAFFDHEIDEPDNTYFNEFGAVSGTPSPGQSWEIDEPGHFFGDIYTNLLAGTLDNSNAVQSGFEDDVSMAMGWAFNLNLGETALLTLVLGTTQPTSGFYLMHTDPNSNQDNGETIYFSGNLDIRSTAVPEPGTWLLMGTGIMSLAALRFRLRRKVN